MFLLCLSSPVVSQADNAWQEESARYLEQILNRNPDNLRELKSPLVLEIYRARNYIPLWSNREGRLHRAYDLLHVIIRARDEGLEPADYYLEELARYWDSSEAVESAQLDLFLSAALYRYSSDVYRGRLDEYHLDTAWHIKNSSLDMNLLFTDVAREASIAQLLRELPPQHAGYQSLKQQLNRYRKLEREGGWERLKSGPVLERGIHHEQVALLRRRLIASGDLVADPVPVTNVYDDRLEEAVRHYQRRHGLKVDGKVGPETLGSLNIGVNERIRQIRSGMERWRWLPRDLGKRYVMVNLTGFELYLVENDSVVLSMPVITGRTERPTPTFSGLISRMEYNPYWTIPKKLALEDVIPHQLRDPSYLSREAIKVFQGWENAKEVDPENVDWGSLDENYFPYWLRQEPGPRNALGRVKIIFSNPFAIYLHDTPRKHLFNRIARNFSSGCVRVKDPVRLAAFLLGDGSLEKEEEVLTGIFLGINQGVTLPTSVPIYLTYWTAWVGQDGEINFRQDVYDRDTWLNLLYGS